MRLKVIDPELRFTCSGCASCCIQPWYVAVEPEKLPVLEQVDWAAEFPHFAGGKELYRTFTLDGKTIFELAKVEGNRCVFLDHDNLCMIHKKLGYEAKPEVCKQFPFLPARAWDADYISASFGCPAIQNGHGELMTDQAEAIAAVVPLTQRPADHEACVLLTTTISVSQETARALLGLLGQVFAGSDADDTIIKRFARALAILKRAVTTAPDDLLQAIRSGDLLWQVEVPPVEPFPSAAVAPMASRFLFAATLFQDTLPAHGPRTVGLLGRLTMVPKLMSLATMRGGYASRLLQQNVNMAEVADCSADSRMTPEATALLGRYLRARMWQQFPAGTQLPIAGAIHQHILDIAAVVFYARAIAGPDHRAVLDRAVIARGLGLVELHLANQKRIYQQILKGWQRQTLESLDLAWASLRMIRCGSGVPAQRRETPA